MLDEVIEYLKKNMSIELEHETEFGPQGVIRVKIKLDEVTISEDYCDLPPPE